ncbi:hypothetical protein KR093_000401 [Drosophila rubida]|uniref:G-protein coupled receptors family 2 profile 2 domain-containing protein n=1 Tax=Drosophila rubida TaxID=30044 RepID=A0AAD4JXD2_9MUSC|nr:hypothetical protein KR093_000401 [Drosophila rubida]
MRLWTGFIWFGLLINTLKAEILGCDYFDTVKLLPSQKLPNGSYQYENILITPEQTGEYDFEILQDGERVEVEKHLRGCACHLGVCIRFCCQTNALLLDDECKSSEDIAAELRFDPMINITLNDGTEVQRHVLKEFVVQHDLPVPCSRHFQLDALNDMTAGWTLFENGTLLRHSDARSLSKQEYCVQPHPIMSATNESIISLVPHNCYDKEPSRFALHLLHILSIICLIITIIVYLRYKKLRNLHGLCFINYMICISVVFIALLMDNLSRKHFDKFGCQVNGMRMSIDMAWFTIFTFRNCIQLGYLGYFAVMAGFNWLTVISYDLWISFKGNNYNVQRRASQTQFRTYNIYAWGVALLLTLIIMILDATLDSDDESLIPFIPGVALYTCWVKTFDWSSMLYFHGIISLQLIFNCIMFTLTAIRIVQVKNELKNLALPEEREKNVNLNRQTFGMFLRLFVIMGIVWTFEIFAYLAQGSRLEAFFSLFDYVNCAQGIIILILFVLKPSVLKLIWDR